MEAILCPECLCLARSNITSSEHSNHLPRHARGRAGLRLGELRPHPTDERKLASARTSATSWTPPAPSRRAGLQQTPWPWRFEGAPGLVGEETIMLKKKQKQKHKQRELHLNDDWGPPCNASNGVKGAISIWSFLTLNQIKN